MYEKENSEKVRFLFVDVNNARLTKDETRRIVISE